MPINLIKERLLNAVGMLAVGHSTVCNITKWLMNANWNAVVLFITSVLSIIYLIYRIMETRKTGKLRELEIERILSEIEKNNNNQSNNNQSL